MATAARIVGAGFLWERSSGRAGLAPTAGHWSPVAEREIVVPSAGRLVARAGTQP